MKQYEITYKARQYNDSAYIQVPIQGEVQDSKTFGDSIGIFPDEGGILEFNENLDLDTLEIQSFLKLNFKHPQAVSGFIRLLLDSD